MYQRTYYEKNRYEICKKTLGVYSENYIDRAYKNNREIIELLYQIYPYDQYVENCFKRVLRRFHICRSSYVYDECYSVGIQAYLYTISVLSWRVHTVEYMRRCLYRMMRVYIICVLNTCNEVKEICKYNNLRKINVSDYRV